MTLGNRVLLGAGWTLRASALICIVWTIGQVVSGAVTEVPTILSSVAFHAAFAVSGATLVGLACRRSAAAQHAATLPSAA